MDNGQLVTGLEALKCFESVPCRKVWSTWDRVLAGCCWEVLISRRDPDSLSHWRAIWQISLLRPCEPPGHRKEVPWELHAASGHNVSGDGERKRPCSGLVKIVAKPRRAKTRVPAVDTACVAGLDRRSLSS